MISPEQARAGAEAMKRAQAGLPKLVEACDEWLEELARTQKIMEEAVDADVEAMMNAGLGEHEEAHADTFYQGVRAGLKKTVASFGGSLKAQRALAKTLITTAKYMALVLEGYTEPFDPGPVVVTPVASEGPAQTTEQAAEQQPQNVPPPVEPSGAVDEFPFQQEGS